MTKKEFLDNIRDNIRIIRESRNISRKALDAKLGLEPGASSKLERGGTKDISVLRLQQLSEIFNVGMGEFFLSKKPETVEEDSPAYDRNALATKQDIADMMIEFNTRLSVEFEKFRREQAASRSSRNENAP